MRYPLFIVYICVCMLGSTPSLRAQLLSDEGHMKVAMRMIGNQLLLHAGNSSSRVLPVVREGERYKISFEHSFSFDPWALVVAVDTVVAETNLLDYYRVEVQHCNSDTVVYSYETHAELNRELIPCRGRFVPKSCYVLFFTPLVDFVEEVAMEEPSEEMAEFSLPLFVLGLAVVLVVLWFLYPKGKVPPEEGDDVIRLGAYRFSKSSMELMYGEERVELSSKEADLLLLLHAAANTTVERADILKKVWGDEGGYVGRTLDVFISKLRKKLEADASIKIVNVRGVGYKLLV